MGNKNSNSLAGSAGMSPKMPMSKIKDDDVELESPAGDGLGPKVPLNFRDYHEFMIDEIVKGSMDREEGLGQLAVLPDECVLYILSFLGLGDIGSVSCTSKLLFFLGRDDALWKHYYRRGMRRAIEHGGGGGGGGHGGAVAQRGVDDDLAHAFTHFKDAKAKQRRKDRKGGKWKGMCRLNFVRLPTGEGLILTEVLLGWSLVKINELLGTADETTNVGRSGAYHYYYTPGLAVSMEEDRVTAVLRNIPLESCTGPAYAKIVPLLSR